MTALAILVLLLFLVAVGLGLPVFAAMGTAALVGFYFSDVSSDPLLDLALIIYQTLNNYVLLSVPLYILVGTLMQETALNERLFDFGKAWMGRLPGGLGVATVVACAIFAAVCGSSVATVATIGLVAFPALTSRGYSGAFSGGLIAAGGTLGILIPPSIAMIIYGVLTEQSIGALFFAGAVPGVLLACLFSAYVVIFARPEDRPEPMGLAERVTATRRAAWALLLPIIILASIYSGIATVTEVAAVAVAYVLVVGLASRTLDWPKLVQASARALRTSVMIFMIVAFGRALSELFTLTGLPDLVVQTVEFLALPPLGVVVLMILVYLVLGAFLEATSMMLITVPILYPVASSIGIDPLAFGVFVVLAIEVAQITPPIGVNLFTIAGIGKLRIGALSLHSTPYVSLMVVMMLAVYVFPEIATWLPMTLR